MTTAPRIAVTSASFGFGPAAKARVIGRALKRHPTAPSVDFVGDGSDRRFIEADSPFDRVIGVSVDRDDAMAAAAEAVAAYDAVVAVGTIGLPAVWSPSSPPLYFVDSLSWLWTAPIPGLEHARAYFVQDTALQPAHWHHERHHNEIFIAPIVELARTAATQRQSSRRVLVSLSGMENPTAKVASFATYIATTVRAIVDATPDSWWLRIACHPAAVELVSAELEYAMQGRSGGPRHSVRFMPHSDFLEELAESDVLLAPPGATTTLEAVAAGVPIGFLLPQNYSQALMAEGHRERLGADGVVAFSRFGSGLAPDPGLPEVDGLAATQRALDLILTSRTDECHRMTGALLHAGLDRNLSAMRARLATLAGGQETVAAVVLGDLERMIS